MPAFEWFYALTTLAALALLVALRVRREPVPLVGLVGLLVGATALTLVSVLKLADSLANPSQPVGIPRLIAAGSLSATMILAAVMLVSRRRNRRDHPPAE